ncbi:MAG: GTP cyclohydrolase I FolE [Anaerolineales bacterium]|nr:GTP cyclohydrolase I FolE [Anaerolineales bacterium]
MESEQIIEAVHSILVSVGEDPQREGLRRTPERVSRMYAELLAGYSVDPVALIHGALFSANVDEMVLVREIEFASLCEHHLLPFIGHAHVAYIPRDKIIGLSKIPRVVDMFAHRLQIQENLTRQIADFLVDVLNPQGVAVVIDALHLCASIRGVKKPEARMVTSAMRGVFKRDPRTRAEFMQHISRTLAEEM